MTTKLSAELVNAFLNIVNGLSPENLMADGERSHAAAARVRTRLMAQWRALEKKAGRKVTEEEVWAEFTARPSIHRTFWAS